MNVEVDRERCTGHGNCALVSPEVFELDEDIGRARVIDAHPPAELVRWVEQAAAQCPTRAIEVTGADA